MASNIFSSLSKPVRQEVTNLGWEKATTIQVIALKEILSGVNALLIAPTGTGKTEAAILPVFDLFLQHRNKHLIHGISILYITPLRALNRDIFRRVIELGKNLNISVQVRHGDTSQYQRRKQALSPPNMLITTPETFQAILPGKRLRQHLQHVRWVIIDEVHELATDKRGTQLTVGLERLNKLTGREVQRIGLSATVGSPELIADFLTGKKPCKILKSIESKNLDVWVESPTPQKRDTKLAQTVMLSPGSVRRIHRLFELITDYKTTLIFTNTRENAEALSSRMMALAPELKIGVHHGSLSKSIRIEIENNLKAGQLKAVVCTSSLELGIDVGDIEFVIQYLSPKQVTRLVQRVGRSGHVVEGKSTGCIIAAWPDDILESAVITSLALDGILELPTLHRNPLDVLAHQIAGLALDWGEISLDEAYNLLKKAWPYHELRYGDYTAVLEQLITTKVVWYNKHTKSIRRRYPHIFKYYYQHLSTIPDIKRYNVLDFLRRSRIGTLDQEFLARNGEIGQEFIMRGQTWRLLSVDDEESLVQVEPVSQSFGAIPSWEGEMIPVPFLVAQQVGKMRGDIATDRYKLEITDHARARLNDEAFAKVKDLLSRHQHKGYTIPTDQNLLIECYENYAIIHSCFGNLVNETLAKVLASLLSSRLGINIGTQIDAYRIAFIAPISLNSVLIQKELLGIKPSDIHLVLSETLRYTSLFTWRLWNVAKRFGIVSRDAEYQTRRARMLASVLQHTPVSDEALREIFVEKMDIPHAQQVLHRIHHGEITIDIAPTNLEYSPLALPILDRIAPQDILRPLVPTSSLIDIIKERLELGRVRLTCIFSGDYNAVRSLRTLTETIRCPKCGSTLVAALHPNDIKIAAIVKKKLNKRDLSPDEEREWQRAWLNAGLVQTYGKRALRALVARGVGPATAVRILRHYHRSEEDFYMDLIRAERDYARTRMFWDR
ncbi:MAG: DEAD/DEAH box helicase [Candidatus Bathyarchaeota archaeon]|nr:DEAD/DEAH box helicase [Candidatus Bathyarchaeota archaeon]